ncbi:MAG: hypothetical protein PUI16_00345 [Clostridia bacterium]|nr:hypothetical protein [Clostridia bacterium]MDY5555113.1 hypothetical protein [Blautia sp.]
MKTDVVKVDNMWNGADKAFQEVEEFCVHQKLSEKDSLRFRLLTEEMMGMVKSIAGEFVADFWAENTGSCCELHLCVSTQMDRKKHQEFLNTSRGEEHVTVKGIMGKIRNILELYMTGYVENSVQQKKSGVNMMTYGMSDMEDAGKENKNEWSLQSYKVAVLSRKTDDKETEEAKDELEKSIVAKLADDVRVRVHANTVEMVVYKKF